MICELVENNGMDTMIEVWLDHQPTTNPDVGA